MLSVSPFSCTGVGNMQFAGKLSQQKIDQYNTGLNIPDSIHISPENTLKRDSAALMAITRDNLTARTLVGGLLYERALFDKVDKEEQALEDKIRNSPVPVTGLKAITFPPQEEQVVAYVSEKNTGALQRFPYILNFRSPSSRQKVVAYVTNDRSAAELLAEKAKNPFVDDSDRVDYSDDDESMQPILPTKTAHKMTPAHPFAKTPSADRSASSLGGDGSDDGQPENSPFHNAAGRKYAPPRPTAAKPVFLPTRNAVKLISQHDPPSPGDEQTPFDVWSGV